MDVSARWVTVNGKTMLSISLPDNQYVTIDRPTGWKLLISLRAVMRAQPPGRPDDVRYED